MFKWSHEYSIDVDLPVQEIWEFCLDPTNWPKWMDELESCNFEGDLKAGSIVKAKIKNKPVYMSILITEMQPYSECKLLIKVPLLTQENVCILQEISSKKTRITTKTYVKSFFVPFMKPFLSKKVENMKSKGFKLFLEAIEKANTGVNMFVIPKTLPTLF